MLPPPPFFPPLFPAASFFLGREPFFPTENSTSKRDVRSRRLPQAASLIFRSLLRALRAKRALSQINIIMPDPSKAHPLGLWTADSVHAYPTLSNPLLRSWRPLVGPSLTTPYGHNLLPAIGCVGCSFPLPASPPPRFAHIRLSWLSPSSLTHGTTDVTIVRSKLEVHRYTC